MFNDLQRLSRSVLLGHARAGGCCAINRLRARRLDSSILINSTPNCLPFVHRTTPSRMESGDSSPGSRNMLSCSDWPFWTATELSIRQPGLVRSKTRPSPVCDPIVNVTRDLRAILSLYRGFMGSPPSFGALTLCLARPPEREFAGAGVFLIEDS